MIRTAVFLAVSLVFITSAQTADQPQEAEPAANTAPVALERMLHGTWYGPDCGGDYTFNPDGTFDCRNFSPGNYTFAGTWSVRWDALPPTLVVTCKTSDFKKRDPTGAEYKHLGKALEYKLLELSGDVLAYRVPNGKSVWRFSRRADEGGSTTPE